MLEFAEMSEAEFATRVEALIELYVREGARATGMAPEAAAARGRGQIEELLPDGLATKGQFFRNLVHEGETAGYVWFAEELDNDPPRLFLYDIVVDEHRRGRGLGSQALRRLEEEARERGARQIKLHVFTHNEGAIRLYERLGYETVYAQAEGRQMALSVD